jgi:glycosyltransferase involved in cell wall biosynthesis
VQSTVLPCQSQTALRIAVVTETYPPEINGVALTIGHMVGELLARGHEIELVRPRQAVDESGASANPAPKCEQRLTFGLRIPNYPELRIGIASSERLLRAWRVRRPDIVHVITEGPLGWSALRAACELGIPVVSDFHTNFDEYSRHYGFGWIAGAITAYLRALHNRSDCTFVPTHEMRDRLQAAGFNALAVVGRGIDTQLFSPAKRSADLRRSWRCEENTPVALYVGRLAAEKNLPLFVESMRIARSHRSDLRVVIVGDGPLGRKLRARNPDFVFAGMRAGEDLAAHYASADLFVFPSLSETFGNVTLEALASGLAVVAFDYAAAREYIVHEDSGLLARCDDEAAFRGHTVRVATSGRELHQLRQRARQTAERLSWSSAAEDLERALLRFVSAPASAVPDCTPAATAID